MNQPPHNPSGAGQGLRARAAGFMLRKTLPPWKPQETIDELVRWMPQYAVDEVIFKIDTEEFSHGLPTRAWIAQYIPWLREAKEKLAAVGVKTSINPWVTLVHGDRGRDCREAHPDVQFMVGHDGTECRACACPLSPGWRRLIADLYGMYASVRPEVLWVEDDIRTFRHRPVSYGCFCPLHLAEFERRTGLKRTREELVANILAPGEPHPDRTLWFDLLGDTMVDVARVLEESTHGVSPETYLGLMTSRPNDHATEGRRWDAFCKALAGPLPLVVRPSLGNYCEVNARGLYYCSENMRRTLACLPRPIIVEPEMESVPFTLYSKSCAFTRLQNALSFVLGADGVTMNIFDHCGSPMENWPQYGRLLAESKPFLSALAQRCLPEARERGVGFLHHPRGADAVRLPPNAGYEQLRQKDSGWFAAIESLGMTTTFQPSPVRAITGQILRAFSRAEVEAILAKGALLDLSSAEALVDMGFGSRIGVRDVTRFHRMNRPLAAEEFLAAGFGGPGTYANVTAAAVNPFMGELALEEGARVASAIVDSDRKRLYPGMTLFENSGGGRVAVYPVDLSEGTSVSFLNEYRQQQLHGVLVWLGRCPLPLFVKGGVYPWAVRRDYGDYVMVAVANLSLDTWPHLKMSLSTDGRRLAHIEKAGDDGQWHSIEPVSRSEDDGLLTLVFGEPLPATQLAAFCLSG